MSYGWSVAADQWLRDRMASAPAKRNAQWWESLAAEWNQGKLLRDQHTGKAFGIRWSHLKGKVANMLHPDSQSGNMSTHNGNIDTSPGRVEADNLVSPLGPKALSEAEMLDLFQVDTLRWEPNRLAHNIWEVGAKGPDGEMLTQPLCQTTLTLKRIEGADSLVALTDSLLASLTAAAPPAPPFIVTRVKADHLLELDAFDLHFGKLGWSPETESSDYDLTIAGKDFREAVDDTLDKARGFKVARALLPWGNDVMQTDNLRSETTAGTRVDADTRYHKMFESVVGQMQWAVGRLLSVAPQVEVVVVPGNHDRLGAYTVGKVGEAWFRNDPRVHFDTRPPLRKYHRFGKTLIGYTHGNEEKHADLPLIMAQERPEDWAETLFRCWRIGHYHKYKQTRFTAGDSFGGVDVRILRSLSGTDAWHHMKGFVKGRRAIEMFLHHIEEGEVGAFISRLPNAA